MGLKGNSELGKSLRYISIRSFSFRKWGLQDVEEAFDTRKRLKSVREKTRNTASELRGSQTFGEGPF
jgi:hypothetical protein